MKKPNKKRCEWISFVNFHHPIGHTPTLAITLTNPSDIYKKVKKFHGRSIRTIINCDNFKSPKLIFRWLHIPIHQPAAAVLWKQCRPLNKISRPLKKKPSFEKKQPSFETNLPSFEKHFPAKKRKSYSNNFTKKFLINFNIHKEIFECLNLSDQMPLW